ncbi:MAG: low molecular weight phosphotyrosine protein phosphatase [Parvularculaceae bacterium]
MKRDLFVCLGNICRFPTADAILRAQGAGGVRQIAPADSRVIKAAARRGFRLDRHRARQVGFADFCSFDMLLMKELRNQAELLAMAPPNRECAIWVFLDFADVAVRETPDPCFGGEKGFEDALDLLEKGAAPVSITSRRASSSPRPRNGRLPRRDATQRGGTRQPETALR